MASVKTAAKTSPKTWKGVVSHLKTKPLEVQKYFQHCPRLVEEFPLDVAVAYVFSRVELAHNMALYCGAVKLHRANATMTRRAVSSHYVTREGVRDLFKTIHGKAIPDTVIAVLGEAEKVRDNIMHGKHVTEVQTRKALAEVFDYAEALNEFVQKLSGFKPFDHLRGFKGRKKPLDESTTRWLLKGLGFVMS